MSGYQYPKSNATFSSQISKDNLPLSYFPLAQKIPQQNDYHNIPFRPNTVDPVFPTIINDKNKINQPSYWNNKVNIIPEFEEFDDNWYPTRIDYLTKWGQYTNDILTYRPKNWEQPPPSPRKLEDVNQIENQAVQKVGNDFNLVPSDIIQVLQNLKLNIPKRNPSDGEIIYDEFGAVTYEDLNLQLIFQRFKSNDFPILAIRNLKDASQFFIDKALNGEVDNFVDQQIAIMSLQTVFEPNSIEYKKNELLKHYNNELQKEIEKIEQGILSDEEKITKISHLRSGTKTEIGLVMKNYSDETINKIYLDLQKEQNNGIDSNEEEKKEILSDTGSPTQMPNLFGSPQQNINESDNSQEPETDFIFGFKTLGFMEVNKKIVSQALKLNIEGLKTMTRKQFESVIMYYLISGPTGKSKQLYYSGTGKKPQTQMKAYNEFKTEILDIIDGGVLTKERWNEIKQNLKRPIGYFLYVLSQAKQGKSGPLIIREFKRTQDFSNIFRESNQLPPRKIHFDKNDFGSFEVVNDVSDIEVTAKDPTEPDINFPIDIDVE